MVLIVMVMARCLEKFWDVYRTTVSVNLEPMPESERCYRPASLVSILSGYLQSKGRV
jgi:hypothetical protein